jgi:phage baseplate assembly protein gpV
MAKPELDNSGGVSTTNQILPGEIIIGSLVAVDNENRPLVDFAENITDAPLLALTTVEVHKKHIGRQVALLFANGNPKSPVIMGLIHSPLDLILENHMHDVQTEKETAAEVTLPVSAIAGDLKVDGKKVVIEAADEIELKCGESSIVLTRAGKIIIRGKYLLSRSSGVNRIMGGSVQVN